MVHSKRIIQLLLTFIVLWISVVSQEYYDQRYDYYDIDHLIDHPRLLSKYLDCFLDRGRCTPVGRSFKLSELNYESKRFSLVDHTNPWLSCVAHLWRKALLHRPFSHPTHVVRIPGILPEIIATACKKCSSSQKSLARKTFSAFKRYYPKTHDELILKLDPENKYYEEFQKAVADS